MPSASPAASSASMTAKAKKKALPPNRGKSEVEDNEAQESGGEDGEDDEGEYEIEAILEAENGHFEENKMGYFVTWKGCGPKHNSWVAEDDVRNATFLIKAFWDKKKSSAKMGAEAKQSVNSVTDDGLVAEGAESVAKKRGRKSVSEEPADKDDERPTKQQRKAGEKEGPTCKSPSAQQKVFGDMQNHMTLPSWDHLVQKVDTVGHVGDTLFVYFTLYVWPDRSSHPFWIILKYKHSYSGERVREDAKKCADMFPKKARSPESSRAPFTEVSLLLQLIDFYESNLRWKEANY
ncbi:hypothetical protein B0H14DRAFT_3480358 [Mycena olivaceomarginata]|nr:hypothetical protein B0H14DRAFT_3480358 [Mycena olivaceomarginata]